MPWLGEISATTEAFQLRIPSTLERAPPARHYFIHIKGSGLYKRRTCGTAAPRGIIQHASAYGPADIKSSPFSLSPFQRRVPPLSPGGWPPRSGGPLTFCPLPTLLDRILRFYSGHLLAPGEGRRAAAAAAAPPGKLAARRRYLFSRPRPRPRPWRVFISA